MNPFLLRSREQLSHWKAFRKSLPSLPEAKQLLDVARYWAQAPTRNRAYDIEKPNAWTSPWEMMRANNWCRFSTAIGMEFTLRLAGWDPRRMALKFIVDYDFDETFFVLEIDGEYWLNHEYRTVIPVTSNYDVLCAWTFANDQYVPLELDEHEIAA